MAHHHLDAGPKTVHWGFLDAALPPVLEIDTGDTVSVRTMSGSVDEVPAKGSFLVRDELLAVHDGVERRLGPHILNGPIFVRGAEPGDALRVTIVEVLLADDWGYNLIAPHKGLLPNDFPIGGVIHFGIDRENSRIKMPWGGTIPARPFFGVIGTAPAPEEGVVTSIVPGSFGGNIDNKELTTGSVLFLPVATRGGLLSVGDGHASQGDGEVCLTAVETGLAGTLRIDVIKDARLSAPHAETKTHLIAMAFDEDFDEAVRTGVRRMIALIREASALSAEQAYRLCSIAADVRITQVVNRKRGVHVMLPLAVLRECLTA
ncbi:acetamidase/formamidase family protein [Beijerinckia sp. L45]|uniref:acetamidase/formamidase family protein n=1 Tax=Beijerinckia sp. L45 TaxID=1641855 RepID=UPI00131B8D93|nr:acetamidase/formamidase family protein [Beijerinckia sp. L45]